MMGASAAATASPSPTPGATVGPTELLVRGRPMAKERVAAWYILGSLLLIVVGIGLNWGLTEGVWYSPESVQYRDTVATGDGETYLTGHPYDVATSALLVVSLVLLGAGFLRPTMAAKTSARVGQALLVLALGLWALASLGRMDGFLFVWITLAVAVPFVLRPFLEKGHGGHWARGVGFVLFGFYWATQGMRFYAIENGDFVNLTFAVLAVPFFNYFAYHEILSAQRKESPRSLVWLSGATFIATGVYFLTHRVQAVSEWLILRVSEQTEWMLLLFGQGVVRVGGDPEGSLIFYPYYADGGGWFHIQIILACTAIQSIMIFVGAILALKGPRQGDGTSGSAKAFNRLYHTFTQRRVWALMLVVPLIYVLNLFRNTLIIWMSGQRNAVGFSQDGAVTRFICDYLAPCPGGALYADNYAAFWFSHNVLGKGGSLVALVIIAFIMFRFLPELYDSIIGLIDLRRRRGPLERFFGERFGRRGNGRRRVPAPRPSAKKPPLPAYDEG